jgi:hypothetical protein
MTMSTEPDSLYTRSAGVPSWIKGALNKTALCSMEASDGRRKLEGGFERHLADGGFRRYAVWPE